MIRTAYLGLDMCGSMNIIKLYSTYVIRSSFLHGCDKIWEWPEDEAMVV